jgi:hypothetical protein
MNWSAGFLFSVPREETKGLQGQVEDQHRTGLERADERREPRQTVFETDGALGVVDRVKSTNIANVADRGQGDGGSDGGVERGRK